MTDLRTAAKAALWAFQCHVEMTWPTDRSTAAIAALRAALAQEQAEPVAWVHTDPDKPRVKFLEWRENEPGYRGRWGKTPLYTAPPRCPNCASLEAQNTELDRNLAEMERAHGIIESEIKGDSHQTLDDAMQQPRAMAQAYEAGYKAGATHEREACETACEHQPHWVACVAAIRARGEQA